jgi:hypothetical protein
MAALLMVSVSFVLVAASRRSALLKSGFGDAPDRAKAPLVPSTRAVAQLSDVH